MPSAHRRIGIVVDEPIDSALDLFREGGASALPEARVARLAILEGALVEALVKVATTGGDELSHAVSGSSSCA